MGFLTHFIFLLVQCVSLGAISKEDLKQAERDTTWSERMKERHTELSKAELIAVEGSDYHPLAAIVTGLAGLR